MTDSSVTPVDRRVHADDPAPVNGPTPEPRSIISEHAVMFGTAAAASLPPEKHSHHLSDVIHAIVHHHHDGAQHVPHDHPHYPPRLDVVLEYSAMEREMHRL